MAFNYMFSYFYVQELFESEYNWYMKSFWKIQALMDMDYGCCRIVLFV